MAESIRILIAEDHSLLREGIKSILNNDNEIYIVGEAVNGKDLLLKYFDLKPDLVLSDIKMPEMDGLEALKTIIVKDPNVKTLFLSVYDSEEYICKCYRAGARGLLSKSILTGELRYAIKKVASGEIYFGNDWCEDKLKKAIVQFNNIKQCSGTFNNYITPAEIKILQYISKGFTSSLIAAELSISKRTVDFHRSNLIQKLNLSSLPELIRYAINFESSQRKENNNRDKSSEGYVLPFVLFVSTMVITLLFGLVTLLFFLEKTEQKKINNKSLDLACYSALQKIMATDSSINHSAEVIIISGINVNVEKRIIGLFNEITVAAKKGNDSSKARFYLAHQKFFPDGLALTVSRPNLRLTVSGNTFIMGNILTSTKNITRGKIFGIESPPGNFLTGRVITDENIKPKLFNDRLFENIFSLNDPDQAYKSIEGDFILDGSHFENIDGIIYVNGNLTIQGIFPAAKNERLSIYVEGNTIIESNTRSLMNLEIKCKSTFLIGQNVRLENAVLSSAKKITVLESSYFKNIQIFSREDISIKNCRMDYPSLLCTYVNTDDPSSMDNKLDIKASSINGTVMLVASNTGLSQDKSLIDIDDKSKIRGFVYSENNLMLEGTLEGFAYTFGFWYYKEPTEYINWLVNVKISNDKSDKWYLMPIGFSGNSSLKILKEEWIY